MTEPHPGCELDQAGHQRGPFGHRATAHLVQRAEPRRLAPDPGRGRRSCRGRHRVLITAQLGVRVDGRLPEPVELAAHYAFGRGPDPSTSMPARCAARARATARPSSPTRRPSAVEAGGGRDESRRLTLASIRPSRPLRCPRACEPGWGLGRSRRRRRSDGDTVDRSTPLRRIRSWSERALSCWCP
jgi:hypothetical protein